MQGMAGGMIQMINHGISTGALFLIVGFIYERRHTRQISEFGGLAKQMPVFATIFMIITFSSIGLPGTNGFVGEFLALMGAFESELRWYAVFATTGVIFAAVYMLWMFQRVMFGELKNPKNAELKDLSSREVVLMLPLLLFVFWIGVYPNTFFEKMNPAIEQLIQQVKGRQIQALQIVPAAEAAEPEQLAPAAEEGAEPTATEPTTVPAAEEAGEAPVLPPGHPPIAPAQPGGH
jgi:NADH-quinone oxidoreductase subunit M